MQNIVLINSKPFIHSDYCEVTIPLPYIRNISQVRNCLYDMLTGKNPETYCFDINYFDDSVRIYNVDKKELAETRVDLINKWNNFFNNL